MPFRSHYDSSDMKSYNVRLVYNSLFHPRLVFLLFVKEKLSKFIYWTHELKAL